MIKYTTERSWDWVTDFKEVNGESIDEDSFEGSAYYLLKEWLMESKKLTEFVKDLVVEPERMSDADQREKTIFEAKELLGMK